MISKETYDVVMANAETLDSAIIYERDFQYNLYVSLQAERNLLTVPP
jgi:ribonucleoside-diphosphate reductase subunit M1